MFLQLFADQVLIPLCFPPLASVFLALERLCPLRTELQQEFDRVPQQWLRALLSVQRFPPETINMGGAGVTAGSLQQQG